MPEPTGKRLRHFFTLELPNIACNLPVPETQTIPPASCRRLSLVKRPPTSAQGPEIGGGAPTPVLNCQPLHARGKFLQFESFDGPYLSRLRAGDFRTQEHFSWYFTTLIRIKLNSRLKSAEAIEDVRQETFARFFVALRDGKILQPERLGSYMNSMCNNVLMEQYRSVEHHVSLDDEEHNILPSIDFDIVSALSNKETEKKVREILDKLPERDRRILRDVLMEERDKDEVCRDFGIDREYLRVLLYRAKQAFKASYLKHRRGSPPGFAPA